MKLLLLLFVSAACLASDYCYEPYGTGVQPEFQVEYSLISITWLNQPRGEQTEAEYALYESEDGTLWTECILFVRLPEQVLGDPDMDAIGHELLHCLIGDFHPNDE